MLGYEKEQRNLNKEQKKAVGILSIGTFLEYFDLMLYIHMAVFLNEIFFPKPDGIHNNTFFSSLAFCSAFVFRPFGAILFGWLGDTLGRKSTVIITTFMMSISCFVMAVFPTYATMGVMSAWVITICRIVQGMSSMGEIIGAGLYITEVTKPSIQFPSVAATSACAGLGGCASLFVATLVTSYGTNWRYAFLFGATIALVGGFARNALRETVEFADAKRRIKKQYQEANIDEKTLKDNFVYNIKVNKISALALMLMECAWPVCFYFAFIHCGNILKISFNFSAEQIIRNNLSVSVVQVLGMIITAYLSYYIYPLRILKFRMVLFLPFVLFCPYLLDNVTNSTQIFLIQLFVVFFGTSTPPAFPILVKHFPVFKRFTYSALMYASSRAIMYVISSFGINWLIMHFNNYGLLIIMVPASIGFIFGMYHFEKLEKEAGNFPPTLLNSSLSKMA
ncbi:MFS transporter [Rickettsia endosymbiont of Halotydeus destructor]|uniref:MFS transporter n=1 Tax=Rickettsia endosymbiont of Halotydeus destructor TaxID=2996754 RepID=UPI003BB17B75